MVELLFEDMSVKVTVRHGFDDHDDLGDVLVMAAMIITSMSRNTALRSCRYSHTVQRQAALELDVHESLSPWSS